jgi:hypothetical protein
LFYRNWIDYKIEPIFYLTAQCVKNPSAHYAERVHDAIAGIGTKEQDLFEVLVRRAHVSFLLSDQEIFFLMRYFEMII